MPPSEIIVSSGLRTRVASQTTRTISIIAAMCVLAFSVQVGVFKGYFRIPTRGSLNSGTFLVTLSRDNGKLLKRA